MLTAADLDALQRGSWRADCPRLRLSRKGFGGYKGSGEIVQNGDGTFGFKAWFRTGKPIVHALELYELQSGAVVPDTLYWNLSATEVSGRTWQATRVLPNWQPSRSGTAVTGSLNELSSVRQAHRDTTSWLELITFDDIEIPCNARTRTSTSTAGRVTQREYKTDVWQFRSQRIDFLLQQRSPRLFAVSCLSRSKLPKHFRERFSEALHLLLGRPLLWTIATTRDSVVLRSRHRQERKARHVPPIPSSAIRWPADSAKLTSRYHRSLIDRYLRHTLDFAGERHPLWGQLNGVWEASTAQFIDAHALTLCVAIEATLALEFRELGRPTRRALREVAIVRSMLASRKKPLRITQRVEGLLSLLNQTSAADRLDALARQGKIANDMPKAWKKLRNVSTHAYQSAELPSARLRELINRCSDLFYTLIFVAIGYDGPRLIFSEPDWPLRDRP